MTTHGASRAHPFSLDAIRSKNGLEGLKKTFHEIANKNRENAAGLLNAERTEFSTLFALQPEIRKFDLHPHLNTRNRTALDLSGEILDGRIHNTYKERAGDPAALRWMLDTGYASGELGENYDEVMDKSALMLAKVCRDKSCQRSICELFFRRNRTGGYTHDLIWAFFEASRPADLFLIAEKLRSGNAKDAEMARNLLNFIPCMETENSPLRQHRCAVGWLKKNLRRLRYTGESHQQCSNPRRYELAGAPGAAGGEA